MAIPRNLASSSKLSQTLRLSPGLRSVRPTHLHCPRPLQHIPSPSITPTRLRNVRFSSSAGPSSKPITSVRSQIRIPKWMWLLLGLMILYPCHMVVQYLAAARSFPKPVRKPLREALRLRAIGEIEKSEEMFQKAVDAVLAIPITDFEPDPLLKLSGIYATWAYMLEMDGKPVKAYSKLLEALSYFGPRPLSPVPTERSTSTSDTTGSEWTQGRMLSEKEHMRAVSLNQKLGQLALQIATARKVTPYTISPLPVSITNLNLGSGPTSYLDAAELHLSKALEALLRLGLDGKGGKGEKDEMVPLGPVVVGRDVSLPEQLRQGEDLEGGMIDRQGLGVTMEALAEVYAKKGQFEYAQQLLVQAISTLLPPQGVTPGPLPRCQAAMLMTSISGHAQHAIARPKDAHKVSRSWALKGLEMANIAENEARGTPEEDDAKQICSRAATVALYNLGMLAEMDSDMPKALDRFSKSLARAREIQFREGQLQASEAIKRIRYPTSPPLTS